MITQAQIKHVDITIDSKITETSIDQVVVNIKYMTGKKGRKEAKFIDVYCRKEHLFAISGMIKSAGIKTERGQEPRILSIDIKHYKTIGKSLIK